MNPRPETTPSKPVNIALVTGAARGIGLAIATRFARRGLGLCLVDRDADELAAAADRLRREAPAVEHCVADVTVANDVARAFAVAASLGPLGAVGHSAGLSPTLAPAADIYRVNFLGTRLVLDEAERSVAPGGAVVVIASMAGHLSRPTWHQAIGDPTAEDALARISALSDDPDVAYGISKLAVIDLVRRRAVDFGRCGVRLNSLSPNITNTPMGRSEIAGHPVIADLLRATPISRVAEPDEIAAAADFLTGPDASYVTGTDLLVDGGCLAGLGFDPFAA
jgi:meso-butanediol dehydrogenase/(S,S)-butanediol dehydrogenase/diacetyl reductase